MNINSKLSVVFSLCILSDMKRNIDIRNNNANSVNIPNKITSPFCT